MSTTPGYGRFGNLSATYDAARPTMPEGVLDYLIANAAPQRVLDLGCGTGIVTRQLRERGLAVTGSDIDEKMIETARSHADGIEYVVAPAERLPFEDGAFDTLTCFSAFHWFANREAVTEMLRVTAPGGHVFVANREYGSFRQGFLAVLAPFIEGEIPNIKAAYEPRKTLEAYGYVDVAEKTFTITERLSHSGAISYVQSTSLWNLVPESHKGEAEHALAAHFEGLSEGGQVSRQTEIRTVLGRKG